MNFQFYGSFVRRVSFDRTTYVGQILLGTKLYARMNNGESCYHLTSGVVDSKTSTFTRDCTSLVYSANTIKCHSNVSEVLCLFLGFVWKDHNPN